MTAEDEKRYHTALLEIARLTCIADPVRPLSITEIYRVVATALLWTSNAPMMPMQTSEPSLPQPEAELSFDQTDSAKFFGGPKRCNIVPNSDGAWEPCKRREGHSGPCAHELLISDDCRNCWACVDNGEPGFGNPAASRMILCTICGNKRCPKANAHWFPCTRSNELGQIGSAYADQGKLPSEPK